MQVQQSRTAALSQDDDDARRQRRRRLDRARAGAGGRGGGSASAAPAGPWRTSETSAARQEGAAPAEGLDQEGGDEGHAALPDRLAGRGDADGEPRAAEPVADQRDQRREQRPPKPATKNSR